MNADANREAFRILRRAPALFFFELLWRWSFGLGVLALLFFAYSQVRQAAALSDFDEAALSSQDPFAVAAAAQSILSTTMPLIVRALEPAFAIAAVLWIAAATIGRGIITRIMVRRFAAEYSVTIAPDAPRWTVFFILNIARVLMLLILVIGYLGGAWIAGLVANPEQNVLAAALIVFASLAVAAVVWSYVNWVLSLAPIFVVRNGFGALDAIVETIAFIRRNYSKLSGIALWNSTLRGLAATLISAVGLFTVAARAVLPAWATAASLVLETFAYIVVSDVFLLARLGAYASAAVRELILSQALAKSGNACGEVTG